MTDYQLTQHFDDASSFSWDHGGAGHSMAISAPWNLVWYVPWNTTEVEIESENPSASELRRATHLIVASVRASVLHEKPLRDPGGLRLVLDWPSEHKRQLGIPDWLTRDIDQGDSFCGVNRSVSEYLMPRTVKPGTPPDLDIIEAGGNEYRIPRGALKLMSLGGVHKRVANGRTKLSLYWSMSIGNPSLCHVVDGERALGVESDDEWEPATAENLKVGDVVRVPSYRKGGEWSVIKFEGRKYPVILGRPGDGQWAAEYAQLQRRRTPEFAWPASNRVRKIARNATLPTNRTVKPWVRDAFFGDASDKAAWNAHAVTGIDLAAPNSDRAVVAEFSGRRHGKTATIREAMRGVTGTAVMVGPDQTETYGADCAECEQPFSPYRKRCPDDMTICGDCAGAQNPGEAEALELFSEPKRRELSKAAKWHVENTSDWATAGDER